jgi:hypothetical protein
MQPGNYRRFFAVSAIAIATGVFSPAVGFAEDDAPFATLQGSWSGQGAVTSSEGKSEPIRCRAKYFVSPSGQNLDQQLRCASDSYHFDVNSGLVRQGDGSIAGTWTETSRNVTGNVTAHAEGDSISAKIAGPSFTADMSVVTKADHQDVQITPKGGDITLVKIAMDRS